MRYPLFALTLGWLIVCSGCPGQIRLGAGAGFHLGTMNEILTPVTLQGPDPSVRTSTFLSGQRGMVVRLRADWKFGLSLETGAGVFQYDPLLLNEVRNIGTYRFGPMRLNRLEVPLSLNWRPGFGLKPGIWPWLQIGTVATFLGADQDYWEKNGAFWVTNSRVATNSGLFFKQSVGIGFEARVNERQRIGLLLRSVYHPRNARPPYQNQFMLATDVNDRPGTVILAETYTVSQASLGMEISWIFFFGKNQP